MNSAVEAAPSDRPRLGALNDLTTLLGGRTTGASVERSVVREPRPTNHESLSLITFHYFLIAAGVTTRKGSAFNDGSPFRNIVLCVGSLPSARRTASRVADDCLGPYGGYLFAR